MKHLFGGAYAGMRVLVTGHTGFKGSWLCLWLQAMGAKVAGIALSPDTEPSHWNLLALKGIADERIDLRHAEKLYEAVQHHRPQVVFHLAAQPLVRHSYVDPVGTFSTNVIGLVSLYEAIRKISGVLAVVNATTDKVYLEQATTGGYSEEHALGGHDPYSTSKACAELVSESYRRSFFTGTGKVVPRLATARAGNVIGGGDWAADRLVPDLVRAASRGTPLQVRNPDAIRPWQHVLEPLSGYLRLGQALLAGEPAEGPWNFGPAPGATLPVLALVERLREHWPGVSVQVPGVEHLHEAAVLQLDSGKAALGLGWRPVWDADMTITRTMGWYRNFHVHGFVDSRDNLVDYIRHARSSGLEWAA